MNLREFLEIVTENSTIALALVGVIFFGLSVTKSTVKLPKGSEVTSPEKPFPRIVLGVVGLLMTTLGVIAFVQRPKTDLPFQKQLTSSYAYFKLSGNEEDCANGRCIVTLFATGLFEAPEGVKAVFENRVTTNGLIRDLKTVPHYTPSKINGHLNDSSTIYFQLEPPNSDSSRLKIQARVSVDHKLTAESGMIGLYLPYFTKYSAIIIDFNDLEFKPKNNLEPKLLANMGNGKLDENYLATNYKFWNSDNIVIVYADNIPEKSNIILKWGE